MFKKISNVHKKISIVKSIDELEPELHLLYAIDSDLERVKKNENVSEKIKCPINFANFQIPLQKRLNTSRDQL